MTRKADGAAELEADQEVEQALRTIGELMLPPDPDALTADELEAWGAFLVGGRVSILEAELVERFRDRLRARHRMASRTLRALVRADASGQDVRKLLPPGKP